MGQFSLAQTSSFSSFKKEIDSIALDSLSARIFLFDTDSSHYRYIGSEIIQPHTFQNIGHFGTVYIYQMIEKAIKDNRLDSNAFVKDYIKPFPYEQIKVKHLLNHSSGLTHDYLRLFHRNVYQDRNVKMKDKSSGISNHQLLDILITFQPKLSFVPGSQFQYSNTNIILLTLLLESVYFKPFDRLLILSGHDANTVDFVSQDVKPLLISKDTIRYITNISQIGFPYPDNTVGHQNIYANPENVISVFKALEGYYYFPEESGFLGFRVLFYEKEGAFCMVFINLEYENTNKIEDLRKQLNQIFHQ